MNRQNFAVNIKRLRKRNKLTQTQLAEKLNKGGKTTIVGWEKGHAYPLVETLILLSELFNVSIDDLLIGEV